VNPRRRRGAADRA